MGPGDRTRGISGMKTKRSHPNSRGFAVQRLFTPIQNPKQIQIDGNRKGGKRSRARFRRGLRATPGIAEQSGKLAFS